MEKKLDGRIRIFGIIIGLILLAIASWMSINTLYPPNAIEVEIQTTYTEEHVEGLITKFDYENWVMNPADTTIKILNSNIIISGEYIVSITVLGEWD